MLKENPWIDQFHTEERRRQWLFRRRGARHKQNPQLSKRLRKILDRLDEVIADPMPVDCVSKKWIKA